MPCFVRTTTKTGYLWLRSGKLDVASKAAPYAYPSAAKLAIQSFNKKMTEQGLKPLEFDILLNRDKGVIYKEEDPYTMDDPNEPIDNKAIEIHAIPGKDFVRIVRINGKYEVLQRWAKVATRQEAMDIAEQCTPFEGS